MYFEKTSEVQKSLKKNGADPKSHKSRNKLKKKYMKIKTLLFCGLVLLAIKTNAQTVTDYDGNVYNTVVIGTQTWMAENLKTLTLNDGTPILISESSFNSTTPNYCWYENDSITYSNPYGALYNWFVVNTGNLCPTGWHVPTDVEWATLGTYLGGDNVAGGKLKETGTVHWSGMGSNAGATNTTGFTALPGGQRDKSNDILFNFIGSTGLYWSSTEATIAAGYAWYRGLTSQDATISRGVMDGKTGISVRCINNITSNIQDLKLNDIQIYPNPATNILNIKSKENAKMNINNMLGQNVFSANLINGINSIDISKLSEGVYVIEVINEISKMQTKLIKK